MRSSVSVKRGHSVCPSDYCQDFPGRDLRAGLDVDLGDRAGVRRGHGVLHLHGLEHEDDVAGGDLRPGLDRDPDDRAGHRREQRAARDRVGGVGEPRQQAQPLADGAVVVEEDLPGLVDVHLEAHPVAVDHQHDEVGGRGDRRSSPRSGGGSRRERRTTRRRPARRGRAPRTTCAAAGTRRCASPVGTPCWTRRAAASRAATAIAATNGPARCRPCVRRRWGGHRRAGARASWSSSVPATHLVHVQQRLEQVAVGDRPVHARAPQRVPERPQCRRPVGAHTMTFASIAS